MTILSFHQTLLFIQYGISVAGILIIVSGVVLALIQYTRFMSRGKLFGNNSDINIIRLNLGRVLILGLEFIVAADLIGTTTTPDYYALGLAAIIVLIRTLLSYSLNREISEITREK